MVIREHMLDIIERAEKLLTDYGVPFTPYQKWVKQLNQCPACKKATLVWFGDEFTEGQYCSDKQCGYEEE